MLHWTTMAYDSSGQWWTFENSDVAWSQRSTLVYVLDPELMQGQIQGGPGARPPLTTKNEAPAPKFYKTEAPEWQF